MQGKRTDRINALIKNELGRLITTQLRDKRLGFVTVTQASVSPDLKYCKVYVSVMGSEKDTKSTIAALEHSEGYLKRELAKDLKLRFTPKLLFKIDDRLEETMRLEKIFKELHDEEGGAGSEN